MTKEQTKQLRRLLEIAADAAPDDMIVEMPDFVEKWKAGVSYVVGKRLSHHGVVYKVLQQHMSQDGWEPDVAVSLFARVLIPDPGVIPAWEQPDSTNPYMRGDRVTHVGKTWESDIDNNVWEPGVYGWHEVS